MTQRMADIWAAGIAEHPQDWHMLQRFWVADLPSTPVAQAAADEKSADSTSDARQGEPR